MKLAQKSLKILSYIEIATGILFLVFAVLTIAGVPEVADALKKIEIDNLSIDINTLAIITCVLVALFSFFYAYLMQKACKDGKKTTLLLVLSALSTVGGLMTIVKTFNVTNLISLLLNAFILYQVIVIRKHTN